MILAGSFGLVVCVYALWLHEESFSSRRAVLESVVAQLKQANLTPAQITYFQLDDLDDAKSLHAFKSNQNLRDCTGRVEALRENGGSLEVSIVIIDRGHAGSAGFIYSDKLLPRDPGPDAWWVGPGEINDLKPVADHWWSVDWSD